jgi:mycothiol system anti-sigma-R factor
MNCEEGRNLIHGFADGELSETTQAALEEHVRSCAECAEELGALQRLRGLLQRSAEEAPSAELRARVQRAVLLTAAEAERACSDPPAIMTPAEVASFLRVREDELSRVIHQIPHFTVAGQLRFRRERVERWIELQEQRTAAAAQRGPVLALVPGPSATWALAG